MKEQIEARIAELTRLKEQALANFHAISGALAENEMLLRQLEKAVELPND
jgi:hypothetical protein